MKLSTARSKSDVAVSSFITTSDMFICCKVPGLPRFARNDGVFVLACKKLSDVVIRRLQQQVICLYMIRSLDYSASLAMTT